MGQSSSSCFGSSGVVVDQPQSLHPYKSNKSSLIRQQDSAKIGGKDDQSSHGIDASPTQSAVPTLASNIDGPPTPDLYADPPPASAVPPNHPILGGISRQSSNNTSKQNKRGVVGRAMHRQASGEAVKDKSRRRLLSYVRDRRSSSSGDSCSDLSVQRRTDGDRSSGGGSSVVGVIKFLSATAEDGGPIPILPEDLPMHTNGRDEETPTSPTKRPFSPRINSRLTRHVAKPSLVVPVPTKTQLFYRDPLVLEEYGLDVSDEATVAGTQIYAARVASVADDQSKLEGGEKSPNTPSPVCSEDDMSSSPASPQSSNNHDESSLLLPNSADTARQVPTISSRGSKHRRFRLFGWSKDKPIDQVDYICNCTYYGGHYDPHPNSQCMAAHSRKMETLPKYRETYIPTYPKGCASILFTREAVRNNTADPVSDIVCVSEEHQIFVADIGLTDRDCDSIIRVAEHCSRGTWAAYTYAKQTLGCREYDDLASVCVGPVMTATATIMETFEEPYVDDETDGHVEDGSDIEGEDDNAMVLGKGGEDKIDTLVEETLPMEERRPDSAPKLRPRYKRQLVLDDREPHLVKYDLTRKERQKLDTHTDKSEWTFLISLSEGCGADYSGGGTFFECIDSTVHLSRGQALIFPGKLRHRGQKITTGRRFLLVGFLVDKEDGKKMTTSPSRKNTSSQSSQS